MVPGQFERAFLILILPARMTHQNLQLFDLFDNAKKRKRTANSGFTVRLSDLKKFE
jgi:hypothetical protein